MTLTKAQREELKQGLKEDLESYMMCSVDTLTDHVEFNDYDFEITDEDVSEIIRELEGTGFTVIWDDDEEARIIALKPKNDG